ncbi:MAG: hypothetical protein GY805_35465 [Chloroflexi bacterium]|nr:hypothetical protein [Chloroflexota bacterium]
MKRWLRRLGYFFVLLFWLSVMVFPTFSFFLATQGELQIGSNPRSHVRFFMVQEEESGGVGIEWIRKARRTENCTQTSIDYILWEGSREGNNASFCQCYAPDSDAPLPIEENSCNQ